MAVTYYQGPAGRVVLLSREELGELLRLLHAMPTAENGQLRRRLSRELKTLRESEK